MANAGAVIVTDVGRTQRLEVDGPWARVAFDTPHWSLLGTYSKRDSDRELSLASGYEIYLLEDRLTGELVGRTEFAGGRGRLVGGASWNRLESDTSDPTGRQTLYSEARSADESGLFGQAGYSLGPVEAVASVRWDESDLHDGRFSPRAALVYAFQPRHTLRLNWSVGFQNPALSEFFLELPVAAPLDLSAIESQLAPLLGGTRLGLGSIPILAVGNPSIELEEVESLELGYSAILGQHVLLTANVYRNELENFVTPLLPTTGTSLGFFLRDSLRLYQPPSTLSPEASRALMQALAAALPPSFLAVLAQREDGTPYIPLLAFGNSGRVESRGFELGLNAALDPWRFDMSYTWFDFELKGGVAESPLEANAPRNQIGLGASWSRGRFDGSLRGRWVEGFDWRSGIFVGRVPSYEVVDVTFNSELNKSWRAGASITNLFDDEHYEIFGGDLLGRRALVYLAFEW
jgi:outer membrane receptor protein involved in Fe transport